MPELKLDVYEEAGLVVSDGVNPPMNLDQRRLFLWVKLGDEFAQRHAILDTGSPYTILSKQVWSVLHRRGSVRWVAHAPEISRRDKLPRAVVAGGSYPFRLGRIAVRVTHLTRVSDLFEGAI